MLRITISTTAKTMTLDSRRAATTSAVLRKVRAARLTSVSLVSAGGLLVLAQGGGVHPDQGQGEPREVILEERHVELAVDQRDHHGRREGRVVRVAWGVAPEGWRW